MPAPADQLAVARARRAARAHHPAGGRTSAPSPVVHMAPLPPQPVLPCDGVLRCPECAGERWRTEYVTLGADTAAAEPALTVRVTGCDDAVWCIECGYELLLPEPEETP